VATFQRQLTPPQLVEGFQAVVTVRSIPAAEALLLHFGPANPAVSVTATTPALAETQQRQPLHKLHLHKFPRTRHLLNLGAATRDDLILSSTDALTFLSIASSTTTTNSPQTTTTMTVQEKLDGANLGISISPTTHAFRIQNRSHYITSKSHPQFKKLDKWLDDHNGELRALLDPAVTGGGQSVLFGEWLYARHSVPYTNLPDVFVVFDLFDVQSGRFYSRAALDERLDRFAPGLCRVPAVRIEEALLVDVEVLKDVVRNTRSMFYDGVVEGLYFRREEGKWLVDRAKVVREDFIAGNERWNRGGVVPNGIVWD